MPTITPTPEQIAVAELNGWDPQQIAESNFRTARVHELMRKHPKATLLRMAFAGGLADFNSPAQWTKQELAATVEEQQWKAQERPADATEFCNGCGTDHGPAECGYNPANDYSAYNDPA